MGYSSGEGINVPNRCVMGARSAGRRQGGAVWEILCGFWEGRFVRYAFLFVLCLQVRISPGQYAFLPDRGCSDTSIKHSFRDVLSAGVPLQT